MSDPFKRYPGAVKGEYGDTEALCDRLVRLICDGTKRATCSARRDYAQDGSDLPQAGQVEIVLNWDESPAAVLRVTEVTLTPFQDVSAAFALDEGEDATLESWRRGHRAFFERNGGWSPEMILVCQRFTLLEVL